jgi:hypothetical protein
MFTSISFVIIICLLFISTGGKKSDIFLEDYTISKDGSVMTINVGVASSMGYVRTVKEKQDGNKKYITFYSTYGINSNLGAHDEFQIDLKPTINEIYFYRGNDGYTLVLQKNKETNEWIRSVK